MILRTRRCIDDEGPLYRPMFTHPSLDRVRVCYPTEADRIEHAIVDRVFESVLDIAVHHCMAVYFR